MTNQLSAQLNKWQRNDGVIINIDILPGKRSFLDWQKGFPSIHRIRNTAMNPLKRGKFMKNLDSDIKCKKKFIRLTTFIVNVQ
jgi:hypothetical protein